MLDARSGTYFSIHFSPKKQTDCTLGGVLVPAGYKAAHAEVVVGDLGRHRLDGSGDPVVEIEDAVTALRRLAGSPARSDVLVSVIVSRRTVTIVAVFLEV